MPNSLTPDAFTENQFNDRRIQDKNIAGTERRQFANTYEGLSPRASELARAIDQYKLHNRRRFITYEEMLHVIEELGYDKNNS